MKQINKSHLLIMTSVVLLVASLPFLNFSSSESTLNIWNVLNSISTGDRHVSRLYELILSKDGNWTWVKINIDNSKNQLNIQNGIVVWDEESYSKWTLSSIWWWSNNKIEEGADYAWIAGWSNNVIEGWNNSVIWWWISNRAQWDNIVIVWGNWNIWWEFGVVIWWGGNEAKNNGIALWGQSNKAWTNSLVMWSWAQWDNVFARNANPSQKSARIEAKSWVLIWTTESIPWVSLVVSGAVKINWNNSDMNNWVAWEIRVVDWCFYAYDWKYWHLISKSDSCNAVQNTGCDFGNVRLQQWDQVTWYKATISNHCESAKVVCLDWVLVKNDSTHEEGFNSPYCYEIN